MNKIKHKIPVGNVPAAWRRRGIGKVQTRANNDVTYSLSDEKIPPP